MIPVPTEIILFITGSWLIIQSFILNTSNTTANIYFKIIPFAIGLTSILKGLQLIGWI